ncbi:hypothetical protein V5F77_16800 [Xanthobacter sp. DSM 24535]|uniref:hypothetical protein n=1 Tax=Roseixanthobacter psychrophilus TaxID=3119917 RepID=UPI00372C2B38
MTLAISMAMPPAKLNTPNAVPRRSSGAVSAEAREKPLRERHVKPPEHDTDHDEWNGRAEREDEVGDDQADDADREQAATADPVGEGAGRIGANRIDAITHPLATVADL